MSRRSRGEVNEMESRVTDLISALRQSGNPVEIDLAGRLWRCQRQREERRAGLTDRVDRPCRHVACEYCRRGRAKDWRARAAAQMRNAHNDHASMVTIMLERVGDLSDVQAVVRCFRTALRNLRDRKIRDDGRWRSLEVIGLAEVDMLAVEDIPLLPPSRRAVITDLPVRSHTDGVAVVVHIHLVVSHPQIPRDLIERVFAGQWEGTARVDVRILRDDAVASDNAGGIIAYASKHRMTTTFTGALDMPVPVAWQARYWGWLHSLRSGLAPLRVRISAMRPQIIDRSFVNVYETEPMPVLFSY